MARLLRNGRCLISKLTGRAMRILSKILRADDLNSQLSFMCPGCKEVHIIKHGDGAGPRWAWNGDVEKPTFAPSILVSGKKLTDKGNRDMEMWRDSGYPKQDQPFDTVATVCHSFVTHGQIQFLTDSTHELAGQTVDLQEWSE